MTSRQLGAKRSPFHPLVETPDANLSEGIRQFNGVYTQRFNRTYDRVGHVSQGRYKSILVQKDAYLLELARYVVLNPVRARMVRTPGEWPWSSYLAMVAEAIPPVWLETRWILAAFGETEENAVAQYARFVATLGSVRFCRERFKRRRKKKERHDPSHPVSEHYLIDIQEGDDDRSEDQDRDGLPSRDCCLHDLIFTFGQSPG